MEIVVLRYGHRRKRDERASMHVALVARALGAKKIVYCGEKDSQLEDRVKKVVGEWGGQFTIEYLENWQKYTKEFGAKFIHLTMYGEKIQEKITQIKKSSQKFLVLVGSQKVPNEAYQLADYNISVTNQPHSEIAALAIFLDMMQDSAELDIEFGGKKTIVPRSMGKKVKVCK